MDTPLFRLVLDRGPRIDVEFVLEGKTYSAGLLVHIHEKGAVVRFAKAHAPALYLAQAGGLRFSCAKERGTVLLQVRVVLRRDEESEREYHFLFRSPQEVEQTLAPWLRTISDRRTSVRLRPLLPTPIRVIIENPLLKSRVAATLADISVGGMSFHVTLEEEELMLGIETVQVSFVLPSTPPEELSLSAKILERRLAASRALIAAVFVHERSARFLGQEEAIRRFVDERQRRMLIRA